LTPAFKGLYKKSMMFIQKLAILLLHLALLAWMLWILANAGLMENKTVLYHFLGMAIYGALLIRGCAWWAKYYFIKEQVEKHQRRRL